MSRLGTIEILKLYKDNVIAFVDSLLALFPDEVDLIVFRQFFEHQISVDDAMSYFCSRVLATRKASDGKEVSIPELIRSQNEDFFLQDVVAFAGINDNKVGRWKRIWQSKRLTAEDRKKIWLWMGLFLRLAEMYAANEQVMWKNE